MSRNAAPADDIAAAWIARLDRLGTTERDHPELQQWLAADIRHRGAFLRARAMWQLLDGETIAGVGFSKSDAAGPLLSRRRMLAGGVAAAGAATLLTVVNWPKPAAAATTLRSGFGEVRRFGLAGGGSLILDGSSVAVLRSDAAPRLDLMAGSVWIDLPDPRLRLNVRNGALDLEAGAAALALTHAPVAEAIVGRGFVDLRGADRRPLRVGAGARVRRGDDAVTRIDQLAPDALDRLLAWRTGDIDLNGETVGQAAARFNAYNRVALQIADPQLARERVVGRFALHRPGDFAEAVATMFGGETAREPNRILIRRAKKDARGGG